MTSFQFPSFSFPKPCLGCLPTVGAGATVLASVLTHSSATTTTSTILATTTFSTPIGTGVSIALLATWLVTIVSVDVVRDVWNQHMRARKQRALEAAWGRQKQAVLHELVTTGILSHMVRNPYTRVLPTVLQVATTDL